MSTVDLPGWLADYPDMTTTAKPKHPPPILRAIRAAGGPSALARRIGATRQHVYQWQTGSRPIPIMRCIAIERETGVPREHLRPDIDWHALRSPAQ